MESVEWSSETGWFLDDQKYGNSNNIEDDAHNLAFVVESAVFSTICEINETIWDILAMEVAWGKPLDGISWVVVSSIP